MDNFESGGQFHLEKLQLLVYC